MAAGPYQAKLLIGELLIDVSASLLDGPHLAAGVHSVAIPNACYLIGLTFYTQGATFSPGNLRLTNAIDVTFGTF